MFFLAFIASNGYFDSTASLDNPSIHPSLIIIYMNLFMCTSFLHICVWGGRNLRKVPTWLLRAPRATRALNICSPVLINALLCCLPLSPGRVELLLCFGSQVVFAQQEAGRHGSRTQTGQQNSRVAAGNEARERVCHLSARLFCLKPLS